MGYYELEDFCIKLWKEFEQYDFESEISNIKTTTILYEDITCKSSFYYYLGHFNYIYNVAANVKFPGKQLSKHKKKDAFFKYSFHKNKLFLVEHIENEHIENRFYIRDNVILQLFPNQKFSAIYLIDGHTQTTIGIRGASIQQYNKLNDYQFKSLVILPVLFHETIYTKEGKYYIENISLAKFIKKNSRINYLKRAIELFPINDNDINYQISMLKDAGFVEYEE